MKNKGHIHFMGIGGSGISGVALLAKKEGYEVSGCDLEKETAYLSKVKKEGIKVYGGHNKKHLKGADMLVTSPAVFYQSKKHKELVTAKSENAALTWQEFLGKFLHKGKKVICIAGAHGKSTTTALAGLVFEKAGLDPIVMVGATVKKWGANFRVGRSEYFITEADEFYDNFLNYQPDGVILNNIEFDHPDYFKSEKQLYESYERFIRNAKGRKLLIVNQDSPGIKKLFKKLGKGFLKSLDIYGYTFEDNPTLVLEKSVKIKILEKNKKGTDFELDNENLKLDDIYHLNIPGEFNAANATGVIILSRLFGIGKEKIKKALTSYTGIGRRLELIGEKRGIKVYDDYAHHPTEIRKTLSALRQKFPKNKIVVVIEPHSYSRTKTLLNDYKGVFEEADKVIIGPIFKARDKSKFGVDGNSIVKVANHKEIEYLETPTKIVRKLKGEADEGDIIIVMGAGESYKWARKILKSL